MQIIRNNFYNFNHEEVNKKFGGDLEFCNSFCVKDEYLPVTVYKCKNPNKEKGHKKYVLLQIDGTSLLVRGMTVAEIKPWRYQKAIHCLLCDEIIHSPYRHGMVSCSCNSVSADGGKEYTKVNYDKAGQYKMLTIDLIAGTIRNDADSSS